MNPRKPARPQLGPDGRASERPATDEATADVLVPDQALVSPETPLAPEFEPRTIGTQIVYRQLTIRGLQSPEAANLTAFLAGLQVHRSPWTLNEVNRVLFLRELYAGDAWGASERRPA